jgi:hypothetical protein
MQRIWPCFLCLAFCIALLACGGRSPAPTSYAFRPHSVVAQHGRVVSRATIFYEGDFAYLEAAGAVFVGTLHATGDVDAPTDEITFDARDHAAARGATHLIPVDATSSQHVLQWTNDAVDVTRTDTGYRVTERPGARSRHTITTISFHLVRVEPDKLASLPAALKPGAPSEPHCSSPELRRAASEFAACGVPSSAAVELKIEGGRIVDIPNAATLGDARACVAHRALALQLPRWVVADCRVTPAP